MAFLIPDISILKDLIPNVSFGYIGVQRNEETAEPELKEKESAA